MLRDFDFNACFPCYSKWVHIADKLIWLGKSSHFQTHWQKLPPPGSVTKGWSPSYTLTMYYCNLYRPNSPPPAAGWRDTRRRAAGPRRCPRRTPLGWRSPGWRRTCPACRTSSQSGSQHPPWHRQSEPPGHSGISNRNTGAGSRENILSKKKIFYPHNKTFFAYHLAQGNFQSSFSPSRRFEIFIIDRVSFFPVILLLNVVSPLFVEKYFLQYKF